MLERVLLPILTLNIQAPGLWVPRHEDLAQTMNRSWILGAGHGWSADPLGPLGWHGGIHPGGLAMALLVVSWCEGSAHRGSLYGTKMALRFALWGYGSDLVTWDGKVLIWPSGRCSLWWFWCQFSIRCSLRERSQKWTDTTVLWQKLADASTLSRCACSWVQQPIGTLS